MTSDNHFTSWANVDGKQHIVYTSCQGPTLRFRAINFTQAWPKGKTRVLETPLYTRLTQWWLGIPSMLLIIFTMRKKVALNYIKTQYEIPDIYIGFRKCLHMHEGRRVTCSHSLPWGEATLLAISFHLHSTGKQRRRQALLKIGSPDSKPLYATQWRSH